MGNNNIIILFNIFTLRWMTIDKYYFRWLSRSDVTLLKSSNLNARVFADNNESWGKKYYHYFYTRLYYYYYFDTDC